MEVAAANGYRVVLQASDVASGLNARRRELRQVVETARRHEVRFLLVEYPDRLAGFGFPYVETLFDVLGVRLLVTSDQEAEDAQAELVKDMLAIVTGFSAKLYGMRGGGLGSMRQVVAPLVTGHRGAAGLEPENTLRSFRRALELGVDAVECDVHATREGRLAVLHDARVDRTTDGTGSVRDMTVADLARLDAGQGERIPLLEDLLTAVGHATLIVELKAPGTPAPAVALVRAAGLLASVIFISFDLPLLEEARTLEPSAVTGALFGQVPPDGLRRARAMGCAWVDLGFRGAGRTAVEAAHALCLRVRLWTPNAEDELRLALAAEPDAITTDRPDRLLGLLGRAG